MEVLQNLKNKITTSSSNSTSGYTFKGNEISMSKRHQYSMFIAASFTSTKRGKQPKCPLTDEWIKKMCTYTSGVTIQPYK
jgi:hypothetical protein